MNTEYFEKLISKDIFSDISIILKNGNKSVHINAHKNILASNNYFYKLLTGPHKEKESNEITLQVSNIDICRDIIMSFSGTRIDPVKLSNYKYLLEYVKCCYYWMVPFENVLNDDLKVPEEEFDLLLEIGEILDYSDRILKIIGRNIPASYDLTGIPMELKSRIIKMEQIDCIASGSDDRTIKIWDLDTGAEIKSLTGHTDLVRSVCYISEKNQIVSGSDDCTIKIWDLNTGAVIKSLTGHNDRVLSLCDIPEKNQIVSGSDDCTSSWHYYSLGHRP